MTIKHHHGVLAGMVRGVPPEFITTWATTSANETITLPLRSGYAYNMTVDWGDGSALSEVTAHDDADRIHEYATAGTHVVTITGKCGAWYFNNGGDKLKFRTVEQWGNVGFDTLALAFYGCANATAFATKMPYYPVTSLNYTFNGCTNATVFPNINVLTDVTALTWTFVSCRGATSFPEVSALTKVISLERCWQSCRGATSFPEVSALTEVTNLSRCWDSCSKATSFPEVSTLTKVKTVFAAWSNANATTFPSLAALGATLETIGAAWWECNKMTTVPGLPASSTALTNCASCFFGVGAGMGGTVVALWNPANFPNITTYANAFTGCTGLANYGDIPNGWKGL